MPSPPAEFLVRWRWTADGRGLLRELLAEAAGVPADGIRILHPPGKPPEIVAPREALGWRCSLSGGDGVALAAVAEGTAVGADVESLRNLGPDLPGLAATFCSPEEVDALRALPEPARPRRLLALWTVKEAVAKALGQGVALPLERVEVRFPPGGQPVVRVRTGIADPPVSWSVATFPIPPFHAAAVAVGVPNPTRITRIPAPAALRG